MTELRSRIVIELSGNNGQRAYQVILNQYHLHDSFSILYCLKNRHTTSYPIDKTDTSITENLNPDIP